MQISLTPLRSDSGDTFAVRLKIVNESGKDIALRLYEDPKVLLIGDLESSESPNPQPLPKIPSSREGSAITVIKLKAGGFYERSIAISEVVNLKDDVASVSGMLRVTANISVAAAIQKIEIMEYADASIRDQWQIRTSMAAVKENQPKIDKEKTNGEFMAKNLVVKSK